MCWLKGTPQRPGRVEEAHEAGRNLQLRALIYFGHVQVQPRLWLLWHKGNPPQPLRSSTTEQLPKSSRETTVDLGASCAYHEAGVNHSSSEVGSAAQAQGC